MAVYRAPFAHGLMFHRFHRNGSLSSGQGSLTENDLDRIIGYVGRDRILDPFEWLERVKRGSLRPIDICLTFDDGLRSQIEVALPVLESHKLRALWFVFSSVFQGGIDRNEVHNRFASAHFPSFDEFVREFFQFHPVSEQPLRDAGYEGYARKLRATFPFYSESDIRYRFVRNKLLARDHFEDVMERFIESKGLKVAEIARGIWMMDENLATLARKGHVVGLHSYDHPFALSELPPEEQRLQYRLNREHVEHATGAGVEAMTHPLGSYSRETLAILADLGIACGFRSSMSPPPGGTVNQHPLELAREDSTNVLKSLIQAFGA